MALPQHPEQSQQRVLELKRSGYMNWPAPVYMETLAVCNAPCSSCPYPTLERQGAKMSNDLIVKSSTT